MKPKLFNQACIALCLLFAGLTSPLRSESQTNIAIGNSYNFTQDQKTTVRYTFTTAYPAEFSLKIGNWESTLNWSIDYDRIYIRNDTLGYIGRNDQSTVSNPFLFHMFEGKDSLVFRVGDAGTYHIDVHSGQADSGWGGKTAQSYSLQLTARYRDDLHEPNDKREDAALIAVGETVTAYQWKKVKLHNVGGDEDWYKFTITTPGELSISLNNWVATQNWSVDFDRLYVYNGAGTVIGSSNTDPYYAHMMVGGSGGTPKVIKMNLSHSGTYYLRFHSGVGISTRDYTFSTTFKAVNDLYEPNDSFATSKLVEQSETWFQAYQWRSLDSTMTVRGDEDYYHFWAAAAGTYGITLKNWVATLNWSADYDRLYIYNSAGNSVGASPFAHMLGTARINFTLPAAGKYVIRLHSGAGFSTDGYEFKISGLITASEEIPHFSELPFIYPNPTEGIINLHSDYLIKSGTILTVFSVNGTLIIRRQLNSTRETIDLSQLPDGIYYAELKTKDWKKQEKLILMRK